jgi:Tol biopolymer transport system component
MFSVSPGGVLAYQEALPQPGARIVWRDRAGRQLRSADAPQGSTAPSLAPDEKRIAVTVEDENTLEDLWLMDLDRAAPLRLTAIHGSNQFSVWSPDGRRIAFRSNRNGTYDLYAKVASGVGEEEELLVKSLHVKIPTGWSPDGRFLVYTEVDPKTGNDIWVLPLEGDRKPFPFLKTEFNEGGGVLSPVPDGQGHLWMAYNSNETGRAEIYLRPFLPGTPGGPAGAKVRVSAGGGNGPHWRKDGQELFYNAGNKLMTVDVKLGGTPDIGAPQVLFDRQGGCEPFADGRRFLCVEPAGEPPAPKINVVLNWTAELKR